MTNMPLFPEHSSGNDDTPLPLIVAKKWDFPLAFHIVEGKYMYAIQDWVRGLSGLKDISSLWAHFKKHPTFSEILNSIQGLPYKATDRKTYTREFTTDKSLYVIAQYLHVTKSRPSLDEIRKYLAAAGVFVDEVRLNPATVLTSGALTPDQALDAVIQMYRDQGKSDEWIQARLESKIKRNEFVIALKKAVRNITPRIYATATNEIYLGLWDRTADELRTQMGLMKHVSLRDHQPEMGLEYQRIAEGACAKKLGGKQELTGREACEIIRVVTNFVGQQAKAMSEFMEMDLATGRPLLSLQ